MYTEHLGDQRPHQATDRNGGATVQHRPAARLGTLIMHLPPTVRRLALVVSTSVGAATLMWAISVVANLRAG
jgi:hypothetical protein